MSLYNATLLLPSPHRGDEPQFNARESAMIRQYERLRTEWEEQLDLLECPECSNRTHILLTAESLDKQLSGMEWKLPDAYTCPTDAAPPAGATSIASAFARLLHDNRQATGSAESNV